MEKDDCYIIWKKGDSELQMLNIILKHFLTDQYYPINLIDDGLGKAKEIDRQDLIN